MNQLTSENLRQTLPGQRFTTVLASFASKSGYVKRLVHVMDVRGVMDELITVYSFWIEVSNGNNFSYTDVYADIEGARQAWDDAIINRVKG